MKVLSHFKKNLSIVILMIFGDLLFFVLFLILQRFTLLKILKSTNKLFEILQNAYKISDSSQLLNVNTSILQKEKFLAEYNIILTNTIITLLGFLVLFLIVEGLVWIIAHNSVKKRKINYKKYLLIPSIYFFTSLLLIFLITPYTYKNFTLQISLFLIIIFLFIYLTSFFYATHYLKKNFLQHLVLPFSTITLVQPFLLFTGIIFILTYILFYLFNISFMLGILFFLFTFLPFLQYSRFYAIIYCKKNIH